MTRFGSYVAISRLQNHYFVEDEGDMDYEEGVDPKKISFISQFLKLPQRKVQAPKIQHDPLVDYSMGQVLTSDTHISTMEGMAHKKGIVNQQRQERANEMELTKVKRAIEKALKSIAKL